MKRQRPKTVPFLLLLCLLLPLTAGCSDDTRQRVQRMVTWEARDLGEELPEERIKEIRKSIEYYEEELNRKVKAGMELGVFYRSLGLEYMALEMYGLALESFREAIIYFPAQHTLAYHAGVCAAQLSKTVLETSEREEYLSLAERYYLRSRQLEPGDDEVAYALAVLYYFEMKRPFDAEDLLERLLAKDPGNHRAGLLLGGVQASLGNIDQAILSYEAVVAGSEDPDLREAAMRNRDTLMGQGP